MRKEGEKKIKQGAELLPLDQLKIAVEKGLQKQMRGMARITTSNFHGQIANGINLAVELCPLYEFTPLDKSQLKENVSSRDDIFRSRVGVKWQRMEDIITWLQAETKLPINIHATFADIGVFISDERQRNPQIIESHEKVCQIAFKKFLATLIDTRLSWQRLSEISPIIPALTVQKFINVSEKSLADPYEFLDTMTLGRSDKRDLQDILSLSEKRVVFEGLVKTYVAYPTTIGCNLALAIERADNLFKLRTLTPSRDWRSVPTINVLCY